MILFYSSHISEYLSTFFLKFIYEKLIGLGGYLDVYGVKVEGYFENKETTDIKGRGLKSEDSWKISASVKF